MQGSNSERRAPPAFNISRARPVFARGYKTLQSSPEPGTATVGNPASRAALCAAASTPYAKPETMTIGYPRKPPMRYSHACRPYELIAREPTTASQCKSVLGRVPRTYNFFGGSGISLRSGGKSFFGSMEMSDIGDNSITPRFERSACLPCSLVDQEVIELPRILQVQLFREQFSAPA